MAHHSAGYSAQGSEVDLDQHVNQYLGDRKRRCVPAQRYVEIELASSSLQQFVSIFENFFFEIAGGRSHTLSDYRSVNSAERLSSGLQTKLR